MIGVLYHGGKSYLDYGVIRLRENHTSPQNNLMLRKQQKMVINLDGDMLRRVLVDPKREKASYNKTPGSN